MRLREAKKCEVYIVLTPQYEGYFNGKSLPAYGRMGSVSCLINFERILLFYCFLQVFLISEVGADLFLRSVMEFEIGNCI